MKRAKSKQLIAVQTALALLLMGQAALAAKTAPSVPTRKIAAQVTTPLTPYASQEVAKAEAVRVLNHIENVELPRYERRLNGEFMRVMREEERNLFRFSLVTVANRAERDGAVVNHIRAVASRIERIWQMQEDARKQVSSGDRLNEIFD